ncbi:AaceriAFR283Wp [[Ashbya] aceris (nom. inval.)]|nr:AaceriAFR283Wp [[Ashbya] aceris (nom. inval.)]
MSTKSQVTKRLRASIATTEDGVHGNNQHKGILDPHLSVLEMLDRQDGDGAGQVEEGTVVALGKPRVERSLHHSISESWQAIKRSDYSFLSGPHEVGAMHSNVGILSSSDTSEEEAEMRSSAHGTVQLGPSLASPMQLLVDEDNSCAEDDDCQTVTISMPSSSTSLVMPKLSLSQRLGEPQLLLVGQPARKFWLTIPKCYQKLFDVKNLGMVTRWDVGQRYLAVMVIFHDIAQAAELLDGLCDKAPCPTVIPVCQKGQKSTLAALLKRYTARKRIRVFCSPIIMSNHHEKHRLLKHLHNLCNESESGYETELTAKSKKQHRRPRKKTTGPVALRHWAIWTASFTIGIGIGCCISLMATTRFTFFSSASLPLTAAIPAQIPPPVTSDKSPHRLVPHFYMLCKTTMKQLGTSLKLFFFERFESRTWVHIFGMDLHSDDPLASLGRLMPLDFIML